MLLQAEEGIPGSLHVHGLPSNHTGIGTASLTGAATDATSGQQTMCNVTLFVIHWLNPEHRGVHLHPCHCVGQPRTPQVQQMLALFRNMQVANPGGYLAVDTCTRQPQVL